MPLPSTSIIRYEGERALLSLVDSLRNGGMWKNCPNIAYRDKEGSIVSNPPLPLVSDLDELPFPSRDYLPYILNELRDIGVLTVATSRGCYMNCGFCSIRNFYGPPEGNIWRARSVENIISEVKLLKQQFPSIREIVTVDDIFTGPPRGRMERMAEFKQALERSNLCLMFSISERVNTIDEDTVNLLRDIGVRQILVGLESASQQILHKLNKGISLKDHKRALDLLDRYGIDATISFINFTPWSTLEQIELNVSYFLRFRLNLLQGMLNRFQIYDGTPLAKELEREGLIYGEFPSKHYRSFDERVDELYEIVRGNLNPYLYIAYQLKILERKLRIALFDAETARDGDQIYRVKKYRTMYRDMMQLIMEEAVAQFLEILGLVKSGLEIDKCISRDIRESVSAKSNGWLRMIQVFNRLCPVLNQLQEDEVIDATSGGFTHN